MAHTWIDERPIYYGTAAERAAFPAAGEAAGALFFDYDDETWYYWDGAAWQTFGAGGGYPFNFITVDATDVDADYTGVGGLDTAFGVEGAATYALGLGQFTQAANAMPDGAYLVGFVRSVDNGVFGSINVGGTTCGLSLAGSGYLFGIYASRNDNGNPVAGLHVPDAATVLNWFGQIVAVATGGVDDAYGILVGDGCTLTLYGGSISASSAGGTAYGISAGAGTHVYLNGCPLILADTVFTGAGEFHGVFQDLDGNLYEIDGLAGSERLINSFLKASDGSPDPAWSVDATGNLANAGGGILDLGGVADALVLDADGDTSISAPTDDQIDFEAGGADILRLVATALKSQGSTFPDLGTTTLAEKLGHAYLGTAKDVYPDNSLAWAACEGRLTLASATPITTADQTAKTTIYFTPYKGNRVAVYDGTTRWVRRAFTELSVAVPATTVTPFDIFIYDNAGVLTLETTNWTNDTTRATALVYQDGVLVKSGATTRRYLGTGRTTAVNGQTEDSVANRLLYNYYNRVQRRLYRVEATSHTYNTAAWRAWNNNAAAAQVTFVCGVVEDTVNCQASAPCTWAAGNSGLYVGAGLNTTAASSFTSPFLAIAGTLDLVPVGYAVPAVGYNYICPVEYATGAGTAPTFVNVFLHAGMWG